MEPERWLHQNDGFRRLARALVGDLEADDLVQEAWLVSLRLRPPGGPGWFAGVIRQLARNRRRSARRRTSRERSVARDEAVSSDSALLEQIERRRWVVKALGRLEPADRDLLVAHYHDEVTITELARRGGEVRTTVQSRLQSARRKLQAELERDGNAEDHWPGLALLAGLENTPQVSTMGATIIMGIGSKCVLCGLVLATLAFFFWSTPHEGGSGSWTASSSVEDAGVAQDSEKSDTGESMTPDPSTDSPGSHAPLAVLTIDRDRDAHGVILTWDGDPVPDAEISAWRHDFSGGVYLTAPPPPKLRGETRSNERGEFRLPLPRGLSHELRVAHPEHAPIVRTVMAGERVEIRLSIGATISGTVVDPDGQPLRAHIELRATGTPNSIATRANDSGAYSLGPLPAGTSTLSVHHRDHCSFMERIHLEPSETRTQDVSLVSGCTLRGIVRDAATGRPVPGASVSLLGRDGTEGWVTSTSGAFECSGFPMQHAYTFLISAPGHATASRKVVFRRSVVDVSVELERGYRIVGTLRSADGHPIADWPVFALAEERGDGSTIHHESSARTDASGVFRIDSVARVPETVIHSRRDGWAAIAQVLPTSIADTVDVGDLYFDEAASVEGTLESPGSKPHAGARVQLDLRVPDSGSDARNAVIRRIGRTDDLGRFSFADLPVGEYRVSGSIGGQHFAETVELNRPGASDPVRIQVDARQTIVGQVVDPDGRPVPMAMVFAAPRAYAVTDGAGRFTLSGVADGPLDLHGRLFTPIPDEIHLAPTRWIDPAPEEDGSYRLELRRSEPARVQVLDSDRRPVPYAQVTSDAADGNHGSWQADDGGRLDIPAAAGESLTLTIAPAQPLRATTDISWLTVPALERVVEVHAGGAVQEVILPPFATIRGRVETAAGTLVAGAWVSVALPTGVSHSVRVDDGRFGLVVPPDEPVDVIVVFVPDRRAPVESMLLESIPDAARITTEAVVPGTDDLVITVP